MNTLDLSGDNELPELLEERERLRLAIRWSRDYHRKEDDPDDELASELVRHLGYLNLKLVWSDGSELTPKQINGRTFRKRP
jgi:hypothetical protein